MTEYYILGQIFGILAWIFFLLSYHAKRENKIIYLQMISSVFYTANYACIGATSGLLISIFELIKGWGYYKTDKDKYIFFYTLPIYLLIMLYTGIDVVVVISVIASIIAGYVALKNKKQIVIGGIISNGLWGIYDLYFLNFAGIFSNLFLVLSNATIVFKGYIKYTRKDKVYTTEIESISVDTIDIVDKLDKDNLDKADRWSKKQIKELTLNKEYSYILIKDEDKIIGYINFLNIKKEIYDKMIASNKMYDNFRSEDIISFVEGEDLYLNLNSIVLKNDYDNLYTIDKIVNAIDTYIMNRQKDNYRVQKICCFAVNELETTILTKAIFKKVKNITNECFLYEKTF